MHQEEAKERGISEAKVTTNSQSSGRLLVNRSLPKTESAQQVKLAESEKEGQLNKRKRASHGEKDRCI